MSQIWEQESDDLHECLLQGQVCILCWKKNVLKLESVEDVKQKIQVCLDVELPEDIPVVLCESCENYIDKFYEFKKTSQHSLKRVCELLDRPIKTETSVTDDIILFEVEDENSDATNTDYMDPTPELVKRKRKRSNTWCIYCLVDLITTENFIKHREQLHGIINNQYKCYGCDKFYSSRKRVIYHERYYCQALRNGYKCPLCEIVLAGRRILELHLKRHKFNVQIKEKDIFQCDYCNRVFSKQENLINHIKKHINKPKFICEICGRAFTRGDYLHKHKSIHTGLKKYCCPLCDYRTVQKSALNCHIRTHTGERPYSCDKCSYTTTSSGNLRGHMQTHSEIKLFDCQVCDKKFGYKKSLEYHMSSAHASQDYSCKCGATYKSNSSLRRHRRVKHCENGDDINK
ncbi:unnamed protein product [Leptosia nina]|uniref:Uncharacterized protein n=1 Tax=Leptosia nina TaxID=320188 RepID=A0AAV1K1F0_9NEOP